MQYPRRIQVKTKTRAQRLPPTEQYRWAVSSTFVALSQHGSTASMLAGCLVGWLFGCLAGSLLRCLGCSRLVCVCACNRTKITKGWQNKSHTCGLPLEMHRAPAPCSWKKHQRASPRKASHEWCLQDYSIPLLSLDSVYKYAQYSCSTHVGFKKKKKKQGAATPPCKASHGHDTFIRNIGKIE